MQIMQKTANCCWFWHPFADTGKGQRRLAVKIMRVMKLMVLFMTVAIMGASAKGISQPVTFSGNNITLEKVFSAIRTQTGYRIFADRQLLEEAGKVSIVAKQLQLTEFLDLLFRNMPLEYMIREQTIFIRKKEKPSVVLEKLIIGVSAPPLKGRVSNAAGLPLQGATVSVRGKSKTTTTDQNGEFLLSVYEGDVIEISYVGYDPISHKVGKHEHAQELVQFIMQPAVSKLEEVTVNMTTGYQRIPKERATGAFSMISEKALERRVAPNLLTLMEGMAPGLVMQYTGNGLEGSKDPNVMIRGVSTFGSTQPLIVVDGFPIEGNISTINPNDVSNITILKDAAAASIWGVKASNGVIVIETKRGRTIRPQVILRSNYNIAAKPSLDYLNKAGSADNIDLEKEIFEKSGEDRAYYESMGIAYTRAYDILFKHQEGTITDAERDEELARLASYDNRKDAAKEFFANNYLFNNTISFSGAPQSNFNYYGSLGYMDGSGLYKGDKQRQANVNFNAEVKLNQKLKLNLGLNYIVYGKRL